MGGVGGGGGGWGRAPTPPPGTDLPQRWCKPSPATAYFQAGLAVGATHSLPEGRGRSGAAWAQASGPGQSRGWWSCTARALPGAPGCVLKQLSGLVFVSFGSPADCGSPVALRPNLTGGFPLSGTNLLYTDYT